MKICVAGQGAFGQKHLDALKRIQGVEVTSLVGGNQDATAEVAKALEIQRGDVLLQFVSQIYTTDGKIVDYTVSYFIPGYFNFHVVRRIGNS